MQLGALLFLLLLGVAVDTTYAWTSRSMYPGDNDKGPALRRRIAAAEVVVEKRSHPLWQCGEAPEEKVRRVKGARPRDLRVLDAIDKIGALSQKQAEALFCRKGDAVKLDEGRRQRIVKILLSRLLVHLSHVHLMSTHSLLFAAVIWKTLYGALLVRVAHTYLQFMHVAEVGTFEYNLGHVYYETLQAQMSVYEKYDGASFSLPSVIPNLRPEVILDEKTKGGVWKRVWGAKWRLVAEATILWAKAGVSLSSIHRRFLTYITAKRSARLGYYILDRVMSSYAESKN